MNKGQTEPRKEEIMKHLLEHALREIEALRRRNEILQAKDDVLAMFGALIFGKPGGTIMGEDITYKLRRAIEVYKGKEGSNE